MRQVVRSIVFASVFWVVIVFLGTGFAKAEIGVTDDEILVADIMDMSGPIAAMGNSLKEGGLLYYKYINDQGGIYGRKLRLIVEDDGYQSPRTVQAAKKLFTKDKVFMLNGILGAAGTEAAYPLLVHHNVPLFVAATQNDLLTNPPRKLVFLRDTGYTIQAAISVKHLIETMGVKNPKVGIIYQEDITGLQYRDGVKKAFAKYGIKNIPEFSYKRGAIDFSSPVAKCKELGITHVFCYTVVREPAMILKEAERIQYKATYFTSNASVYPKTLELAGPAVDYCNGYYGIGLMGDLDSKGEKLLQECIKKYGISPKADPELHRMGFASAITTVEVLRRAGKNLTREGFIKAAETLTNYDTGLCVPVTYRPDRRDGGRVGRVYKAEKGHWVRLTGWIGEE